MTQTEQHYTFGDSERAAQRLRLLAQVFEPSSSQLLSSMRAEHGALGLDLGCGPGHSSALLLRHTSLERVIGLDQSPRLLEHAGREQTDARLSFLSRDVAQPPFGLPLASVVYARFLLTHLRNPAEIVASWASALLPGGCLVLEETAHMTGEHEAFAHYYALVERMQAHYGQRMYIGRELEALSASPHWDVERSQVHSALLPAKDMARLHLLNLQSWSGDAFARAHYPAHELAELAQTLRDIADGRVPSEPVRLGMGQIMLRKLALPTAA